jgi:hypothetical protein
MRQLKPFIFANLYLILPPPLLILLVVSLTYLFALLIDPAVRERTLACDFSAGGGSLNLCTSDIWLTASIFALVIGTLLTWLLCKLALHKLHWRSPIYGIILCYALPIAFFTLHNLATQSAPIRQRGWINNILFAVEIVVFLILGIFFSQRNYREYAETKMLLAVDHQERVTSEG